MSMQISMILFGGMPDLSAKELEQALSSNWPDLPSNSDVAEQDNTLSFRLGTADVVIGTMPAAIPWSDLEGPCSTSILWPDAASVIREHESHAIVTVRGELSPIELSTLLTQATAASMASSPQSLGVFWTNAALVVPKDLFFDFAVQVMPHGPPLPIWVDCRVGWNESKSLSTGFTTGLVELGLMELEALDATEPPAELKKRFEAIAGYLLENGPIIKNGDTVGESADEKIRIVHSNSAFGIRGTVMRLAYESARATRPWWKRL